MREHLSAADLLTALKYCTGLMGGDSCVGCPNAVPGSADVHGMCSCRFNTTEEMIHLLESIVKK